MNLHQLNLAFDARQDRLLLRVNTTEGHEFRFWLTRRLVQRAWPRVVTVLQALPPAMAATAKGSAAPLEFRHAAAVQQADFATPYFAAEKAAVVREEPLLVSQFALRSTGLERYEMTLAAQGGPSVSLKLAAPVLHGFVKLVQDSARAADWGLALALPAAEMASLSIN